MTILEVPYYREYVFSRAAKLHNAAGKQRTQETRVVDEKINTAIVAIVTIVNFIS